jgi:hypothetical protein
MEGRYLLKFQGGATCSEILMKVRLSSLSEYTKNARKMPFVYPLKNRSFIRL